MIEIECSDRVQGSEVKKTALTAEIECRSTGAGNTSIQAWQTDVYKTVNNIIMQAFKTTVVMKNHYSIIRMTIHDPSWLL